MRRAAGLLTRGSLPRRLPGSATQWRRGGRASPLTAAGPSRTCTGVPSPLAGMWRESSIASRGRTRACARPRRRARRHAAAVGRLARGRVAADARRARRARRTARRRRRCSTRRSATGGRCWRGSRPTALRSGSAPVPTRTRRCGGSSRRAHGSASSATRRASSPSIALAHAGAARQVEVVGTLAEVRAALGGEAVVVRSREELAGLR